MDDFDFDFEDDFGIESDARDDRSPVVKTISGFGKAIKGDLYNEHNKEDSIKKAIGMVIPESALDMTDSIRDTFDESSEIVEDTLNTIKTKGAGIADKIKAVMPKNKYGDAVSDFLSKHFKAEEPEEYVDEEANKQEALARERDAAIIAMMGESLSKDAKLARMNSAVTKHMSESGLTINARTLATLESMLSDRAVANNYYRNSLRLKWEILHANKEQIALMKNTAEMQNKYLGDISHNTSLPDMVKYKRSEVFKDNLLRNTIDNLQEGMLGEGSSFDAFKKNVTSKVKGAAGSAITMLDMGATEGVNYEAMAGAEVSKKLRAAVGKRLRKAIGGTETGNKVLRTIDEVVLDTENSVRKLTAKDENGYEKDNLANGIVNGFADLFHIDGTVSTTINKKDLDDVGVLDNRFRDTVVNAIPQLLNRINSSIVAGNGGSEDLTFDYDKGVLIKKSELKGLVTEDIKNKLMTPMESELTSVLKVLATELSQEETDVLKHSIITNNDSYSNVFNIDDHKMITELPEELRKKVMLNLDRNILNQDNLLDESIVSDFNSSLIGLREKSHIGNLDLGSLLKSGKHEELMEMGILDYNSTSKSHTVNNKALSEIINQLISVDQVGEREEFEEDRDFVDVVVDMGKKIKDTYSKQTEDKTDTFKEVVKETIEDAVTKAKDTFENLSTLEDKDTAEIIKAKGASIVEKAISPDLINSVSDILQTSEIVNKLDTFIADSNVTEESKKALAKARTAVATNSGVAEVNKAYAKIIDIVKEDNLTDGIVKDIEANRVLETANNPRQDMRQTLKDRETYEKHSDNIEDALDQKSMSDYDYTEDDSYKKTLRYNLGLVKNKEEFIARLKMSYQLHKTVIGTLAKPLTKTVKWLFKDGLKEGMKRLFNIVTLGIPKVIGNMFGKIDLVKGFKRIGSVLASTAEFIKNGNKIREKLTESMTNIKNLPGKLADSIKEKYGKAKERVNGWRAQLRRKNAHEDDTEPQAKEKKDKFKFGPMLAMLGAALAGTVTKLFTSAAGQWDKLFKFLGVWRAIAMIKAGGGDVVFDKNGKPKKRPRGRGFLSKAKRFGKTAGRTIARSGAARVVGGVVLRAGGALAAGAAGIAGGTAIIPALVTAALVAATYYIGKKALEWAEANKEYLKSLGRDIAGQWNKFTNLAGDKWDSMTKFTKESWDDFTAIADDTWTSFTNLSVKAWDGFTGLVGRAWDKIGGYWDKGIAFMGGIPKSFKDGVSTVSDFFTDKLEGFTKGIKTIFRRVSDTMEGFKDALLAPIIGLKNMIADFIGFDLSDVKDAVTTAVEYVGGVVETVAETTSKVTKSVVDAITEQADKTMKFFGGDDEKTLAEVLADDATSRDKSAIERERKRQEEDNKQTADEKAKAYIRKILNIPDPEGTPTPSRSVRNYNDASFVSVGGNTLDKDVKIKKGLQLPAEYAGGKNLTRLERFVLNTEDYSEFPYWDHKQWTNGYGTKAKSPREQITVEESMKRFKKHLHSNYIRVKKFTPEGTPDGIVDALASLSYNTGYKWMSSGLGKKIKKKDWAGAKGRFMQYNKASGKVNDGLVRRRSAEAAWFDDRRIKTDAKPSNVVASETVPNVRHTTNTTTVKSPEYVIEQKNAMMTPAVDKDGNLIAKSSDEKLAELVAVMREQLEVSKRIADKETTVKVENKIETPIVEEPHRRRARGFHHEPLPHQGGKVVSSKVDLSR